MDNSGRFDAAQGMLQVDGPKIRREEMLSILNSLGFRVRDGRKGGHKIYFHDEIEEFQSASYNCGHGKNPEIKPVYVRKVSSVLTSHETALKKFLGEEKNDRSS